MVTIFKHNLNTNPVIRKTFDFTKELKVMVLLDTIGRFFLDFSRFYGLDQSRLLVIVFAQYLPLRLVLSNTNYCAF